MRQGIARKAARITMRMTTRTTRTRRAKRRIQAALTMTTILRRMTQKLIARPIPLQRSLDQ